MKPFRRNGPSGSHMLLASDMQSQVRDPYSFHTQPTHPPPPKLDKRPGTVPELFPIPPRSSSLSMRQSVGPHSGPLFSLPWFRYRVPVLTLTRPHNLVNGGSFGGPTSLHLFSKIERVHGLPPRLPEQPSLQLRPPRLEGSARYCVPFRYAERHNNNGRQLHITPSRS